MLARENLEDPAIVLFFEAAVTTDIPLRASERVAANALLSFPSRTSTRTPLAQALSEVECKELILLYIHRDAV